MQKPQSLSQMKKQQEKKLYFITRSLTSNNFQQILLGLYQSRIYISHAKSIDLLNSLIISLTDFFNKTKYSFIKVIVTSILTQCSQFISRLPSKTHVISTISNNLKSNDTVVRILSMQLVEVFHKEFSKDSSVYHLMFSKLKWKHQMMIKQQIRVIRCLSVLLEKSQYLSQMFSNNLAELIELGGVDVKIILYLCLYARFQGSQYPKILATAWKSSEPLIINSNQMINQTTNERQHKNGQTNLNNNHAIKTKSQKTIIHHLIKLLIKCCVKNYQCIQQYNTQYIQHFPQISPTITRIQKYKYNFLNQSTITMEQYDKLDSYRIMLDLCYQCHRLQIGLPQLFQNRICNKIIDDMNGKQIPAYAVLLTFYLSNNVRQLHNFDKMFADKLSTKLTNKQINISVNGPHLKYYYRLLKISLTSANYSLASKIIEMFMNLSHCNKISAFVLLQSYAQLHVQPTLEKLTAFLIISGNLAIASKQPYLLYLCKLWENKYGILYQNQEDTNKQPKYQLQQLWQYYLKQQQAELLKQAVFPFNKHIQQTSNDNTFSKQGEYLPEQNKLILCQEQIDCINNNVPVFGPVCLAQMPYNTIYFTKKTIIDIFKFLD